MGDPRHRLQKPKHEDRRVTSASRQTLPASCILAEAREEETGMHSQAHGCGFDEPYLSGGFYLLNGVGGKGHLRQARY